MSNIDPLVNLFPSLVQCFSVIFIGYIAARLSLITSQASAIGTYATKFAMPALFFRSIASLDFNDVNWLFVLAISLGKLILLAITCLCIVLTTKPINYGMAGILSIFVTQSNAVALGYPILSNLYPDLAKYIYLFAPSQFILINPICFVLLEWHQYKSTSPISDELYLSPRRRILLVFKKVILNPLIFMTILGVIFNYILNHNIPLIIDRVLQVLANSFTGVALFYLGLNMVGKLGAVTRDGAYVLVFILLAKLVFLPFLTRELVVHIVNLGNKSNLSLDYSFVAFLYGGLPTAPAVFLIAKSFQVLPDIIATGLVLGTLLSGPLIFLNARIITMVVVPKSRFNIALKFTSTILSIISIFGCIWVLTYFVMKKRFRSPICQVTIFYTLYVLITSSGVVIGRILIEETSNNKTEHATWSYYIQSYLFFFGCFGSRFVTILIAATMMILKRKGIRCLLNNLIYLHMVGFCVPVVVTLVFLLCSSKQFIVDMEPSLQYDSVELFVSFTILATCIILTVIFLTLKVRPLHSEAAFPDRDKKTVNIEQMQINENLGFVVEDQSQTSPDNGELEDLKSDTTVSYSEAESEVPEYTKDDDEFHIQRHFIHTIILVVTMGFGLFLCFWRLIKEEISGVYIELEFLHCIFFFGQGFILWAIFGINIKLIISLFGKRILALWIWIRKSHHFRNSDAMEITKEFVKCHLENCRSDIVKDGNYMSMTYTDVFSGKNLIDWIIRIGLANNRADAIVYGQSLLIGRVIEHITTNESFIDDDEYLYRFFEDIQNPEIRIDNDFES